MRSSTGSELVGVNDMMSSILWMQYFLVSQGYHVTNNIVYQDNQSAILLAKYAKALSGKQTKHIDVRYFFVKDQVDKGNVRIKWCPTKEMIADFFTKPLQLSLFKCFHDVIMGVVPLPEYNLIKCSAQ